MTTIYAAVIEWPTALEPAEPVLILARNTAERDTAIAAAIRETANMLTEPEWRDAITATSSREWLDWVEALSETTYDSPFVTTYEREWNA